MSVSLSNLYVETNAPHPLSTYASYFPPFQLVLGDGASGRSTSTSTSALETGVSHLTARPRAEEPLRGAQLVVKLRVCGQWVLAQKL